MKGKIYFNEIKKIEINGNIYFNEIKKELRLHQLFSKLHN
jgi:hypothetical protein